MTKIIIHNYLPKRQRTTDVGLAGPIHRKFSRTLDRKFSKGQKVWYTLNSGSGPEYPAKVVGVGTKNGDVVYDVQLDYEGAKTSTRWGYEDQFRVRDAKNAAHDSSSHVTSYLNRVDAHLATLTGPGMKLSFLRNERNKWITRYEDFMRRVDSGRKTDPDVTAWDFQETIGGLDIRIGRV